MSDFDRPSAPDDGAFSREADNLALRRYLDAIGKVPLLTHDDEIRLSAAAQAGDDGALKHLAEANLRLVVHLVRRYSHRGVPLRDLIAAGNHGLVKAARTYRARPDSRFSGYAVWWVRRHLLKALMDEHRTARIPLHRLPVLAQLRRGRDAFLDGHGREPTPGELAELTGLAPSMVVSLLAAGGRPASLQAPLSAAETGGATLGEMIPDDDADSPATVCERGASFAEVASMIDRLPTRDAHILRARFGLDDGEPRTFEEIGRRFGLTRERVRQIQDTAIRRIRREHEAMSRVLSRAEIFATKLAGVRDAVLVEFVAHRSALRKGRP